MRDNLTELLINGLSPGQFRSSSGSVIGDDSDGQFTSVLASTLTTVLPILGSTASPLNRSMGFYDNDAMESYANGSFVGCPSTNMPALKIVFTLLYSVVGIVGLLGNSLVIYVVLRYSNMQTVTNMYILNLAIADECFLIGIPFLIATMNISQWPFGTIMCKAYMVSTSITQFSSSIFLLVMSTDRYIAICHHVSSPKYRTPTVSRIVAAAAWVTSALIMLPIIMYATTVEVRKGTYTCHISWPQDGHTGAVSFIIYSATLGFAIPLCFIMTFYCLVIRKLRSLSKKTNKSHNKRRSHRKVTKLVLTVITVYILCWLPYWTSQMALIANHENCNTRLSITIFLLVGCLGYSNSAINPILYAYLSDNFKKSFLKACVCAGAREVNAQLKVENSVLPRKLRNGKRLNSDFGTTTMISSTVPGSAAAAVAGKHKQHHRTFQAETTLGTSGATTTTTSISMLPSSIIPSPTTATIPSPLLPSVAGVGSAVNQNGHNQHHEQQEKSLNDYNHRQQEMEQQNYRDKLPNDGEEGEDDDEEEDIDELPRDDEDGGDDCESDEGFRGRPEMNLIKI